MTVYRIGKRGAVRGRCEPCERVRRAAVAQLARAAKPTPSAEFLERIAERDRVRQMTPEERATRHREMDLAAYHRRVSTPEGRERFRLAQRRTNIRKNYGITLDDYDTILAAQSGGCGICGKTKPNGRYNTFHVDHDHETGAVRGLLCEDCNLGLGRFKDSPTALAAAIKYLASHPSW